MAKHKALFFTVFALISLFVAFLIPQANSGVLLGIILGLLAGIIAFFRIEFGIYILVFSMLLSPEIKLASLPGRDVVMRIDDFILLIVFFAWFSRIAIDKSIGLLKNTPLNISVITYTLACVIFTLKGIITGDVNPVKSFFYVAKYIEYFLLFFMVSNVVKDEKDVKKYLFGALITLIIVTVYCYTQVGKGVRITAPFEDPLGVAATSGEPAALGGYFVIVLAIFTAVMLNYKNNVKKLLALSGFIFIMPPFSQTFSRASYIAFGVMLLFTLFLTKKNKLTYFLILLGAVVIMPLLLPGNITGRVLETFQGRQADTGMGKVSFDESSRARIESWENLITVKLPKHLLTGYGVTGVSFIDGQYFTVLGEVGIIGFALFAWMIIAIYKMGYAAYKTGQTEFTKSITFGFTVSFIALLFHALTANTFIIVRVMEPFWFLAALVSVLNRERSEKTTENQMQKQ
ncbi:MAG: O-antigen ligase family protein [Candidatus Firestonebacteria bacterium]